MNDPNEHLLRAALVALFARELGTISPDEAFGVILAIEAHLASQGGASLAWVQRFHDLRMQADQGEVSEQVWRTWVSSQLTINH